MRVMDVVFLAPGYPGEMPLFARGLAEVGAHVIGVGDQPLVQVPEIARRALGQYVQIGSWADEDAVVSTVLDAVRGRNVDLVETLWEPTVLVAARLREAIGTPGMTVDQTIPFRDKGRMKEVLDAAAVRTPRSARATTAAGCREAAEQIGYPLIVKPISGAGSLDTYRLDSDGELEAALPRLRDQLLQHRRVPPPSAGRQAGGVDQPAGHLPPRSGRPGARRRSGDG
jgi:biotin carboxylase